MDEARVLYGLALFVILLSVGCAERVSDRDRMRGMIISMSGTWYYYDLGPNEIAVSSYPPEQRAHYKTFVRICSECHKLSRAINSPESNPVYWKDYIDKMNTYNNYTSDKAWNDKDMTDVYNFMVYDSQIRKIKHKKEFDAKTVELQRRYEALEGAAEKEWDKPEKKGTK
jgi:hypothetical protein